MIFPTFYFRPLHKNITLSYAFGITLRNPTHDELPIFQQSLKTLSSRLSDKERRRILYTLYPLGLNNIQGTLEEIFITELSKIWVVATYERELPFEQGMIDYGYLCGYYSNDIFLENPGSFIADIHTLTSRQIFRALKRELPKAAQQILNSGDLHPDLSDLEELCAKWDGILTNTNTLRDFTQIAKALRMANETPNHEQKFLHYCLAFEILLCHNPSSHFSKMPINRQFSSKAALIRHLAIKNKNQTIIKTPIATQELYKEIYEYRSQLLHGRGTPTKKKLAELINELYPTLRLALELQINDPLLVQFIYMI